MWYNTGVIELKTVAGAVLATPPGLGNCVRSATTMHDHTTPLDTPQLKTCSQCGEAKQATAEFFYRATKSKDGLQASCKECKRKYLAANQERLAEKGRAYRAKNRNQLIQKKHDYYLANREKIVEKQRAYVQRNFAQVSAQQKAWRESHKEHVSQQKQAYYVANREQIREEARKFYAANRERIREAARKDWAKNQEKYRERARIYYAEHRDMYADSVRSYQARNKERVAQRARAYYLANQEKRREYNRIYQNRRRGVKIRADGTYSAEDIALQYERQKGRCHYCKKKVGNTYHVDHVVPLSRGGTNWPDNLVVTCPHCNLSKNNKLPHEWIQGGKLL